MTCARRPRSVGARDEWIAAGVGEALRLAALAAYDRMVGPGAGTPGRRRMPDQGALRRGSTAGKSPVDRAKQGVKRSQLTEAYGIPLVTDPAPANIRDHNPAPGKPWTTSAISPRSSGRCRSIRR